MKCFLFEAEEAFKSPGTVLHHSDPSFLPTRAPSRLAPTYTSFPQYSLSSVSDGAQYLPAQCDPVSSTTVSMNHHPKATEEASCSGIRCEVSQNALDFQPNHHFSNDLCKESHTGSRDVLMSSSQHLNNTRRFFEEAAIKNFRSPSPLKKFKKKSTCLPGRFINIQVSK